MPMINLPIPWIQVEQHAKENGLELDWVGACIMTESLGKPYSVRYEPNYQYLVHPRDWADKLGLSVETEECMQKCSFGYMHVMGGLARELGFDGMLPELFDVDLNLKYGTLKLKLLMQKYGNIHDSIAAYNAGSVRKTDGGFYVNQKHVDRFDQWLRKIREDRL